MKSQHKKASIFIISVLLIVVISYALFKSHFFEPEVCKVARNLYTNTESGDYEEVLQLLSKPTKSLIDKNQLIRALEIGRDDMKLRGGLSSIDVEEIYSAGDSSFVYVNIYYKGHKDDVPDTSLEQKTDTLKLLKEDDRWVIYLQPLF